MTGTAALLGEREIIFPEILALAVGAWGIEKQPWRANRLQLFTLMSLGAIIGYLIVRFVRFYLPIQIMLGLLIITLLLSITKTTIYPMISACILPILLQTDTWIYPLSVIVLTGIIILVQKLMELADMRSEEPQNETEAFGRDYFKSQIPFWGKWFLIMIPLILLATLSGWYFLIAPPLIVAYTELYSGHGTLRKHPWLLFFQLTLMAWCGTFMRLIACEKLGLPLWLGTLTSVMILFICFEVTHLTFPPAGAVILLPFLLPSQTLIMYPLLVTIGAAVFIGISVYQFSEYSQKLTGKITGLFFSGPLAEHGKELIQEQESDN